MADAPPTPSGGRKILGLKPKTALIASVAIIGGALVFFWWRGRQAKTSSAASASASSSAAGGTGYQEQIDALEQEVDLLLSDQYPGESGGSGGTGSGSGGGGGGTGTTPCPKGQTRDKDGKCVDTTKKTGGGGTTTKEKPKPAMPSGVKASKVGRNGFTVSWAKDPNATSYRVRVTYQDKLVGSPHTTSGTSLAISGLSANRTYTVHVAAIGPGGTSSETNGPAVKTA
jgi:hypothetical protein